MIGDPNPTCGTCGQSVPAACDRCGRPAKDRHQMRHVTFGHLRWWCGACFERWVTAKEFREFEVSVKFGDYPAASLPDHTKEA